MKLLLDFSGEHSRIPEAELHAVLLGEMLEYSAGKKLGHRTLLLDVECRDYSFLDRLGFTKDASEILAVSRSLDDVAAGVFDRISSVESFRVRSDSRIIETRLGEALHNLGLKVRLRNPNVQVTCRKMGGEYYAGLYIQRERSYSLRKPQHRPFFHPTSMHPKLARALVNLAKVGRGDRILDPCCGTGGILIEAGLMGMQAIGFDIDGRMVDGCKRNLSHYGITGDIRVGDALELRNVKADAIVTDPPYGRASYSSMKKTDALYEGIAGKAVEILPAGRRIVLTLPAGYTVKQKNLNLLDVFDVRVHRSLTRRIHVLEVT
jgi:tRNA (guanine10-N2)-dimethyltransferase